MSDLLAFVGLAFALAVGLYLLGQPPRPPPGGPRAGGTGAAPPRTLVACFLALACLSGCAAPLNTARVVVGTAANLYNANEPRIEAAEKRALDACLTLPVEPVDRPACVDRVVEQWAPVKAALVVLDGAIHAARGALLIADAAALTGAPVAVDDLARQVAEVLDAAVTLQRLTAPKAVAPLLPARVLPVAPSAPVAQPAKGGAS